jgi:hypothetical protein
VSKFPQILRSLDPKELRRACRWDSKSPAAKRRRERGLYTAEEVASRVGICRESISLAIHAKKIPTVTLTGKRRYVTATTLRALMQLPGYVERIFSEIQAALGKTI